MNTKHKTRNNIVKTGVAGFVFFVLCSMFRVPYASAQSILPLTVAPARQQVTINPGEDTPITVKFYNQSDAPLSGFVKVADFVVQDDKGTPTLVEDSTQVSPKFSGSAWVTLPYDRMTIAPNDRTIVQASLKVPANARPGGRYVAIYFEPTSPLTQVGEAGASITPRIVSLLYVRVNGPITEYAFISDLFAQSFREYGPIAVTAQISNKGDYHIRPRGTFTLSNMFGTTEQSTLNEVNIFPDALRTYTASIGSKWMLGRYQITLTAQYGDKAQTIERSIYVWVFPWRVALVILLSLIILILLGRSVYKGVVLRESSLEEELSREREEIEKLKHELHKRD